MTGSVTQRWFPLSRGGRRFSRRLVQPDGDRHSGDLLLDRPAAFCMQFDLGLLESGADLVNLGESSAPVPALLVEPAPWYAPFLENLNDLLWKAEPPRLRLASKPGDFWPDVFVAGGVPWVKFGQSVLLHGMAAAMLWVAVVFWPRPPRPVTASVFRQEDVISYSASEYLPPLDTGSGGAPLQQKGDPVLAPQPILSVPPESDNRTQTVVAPPNLKLQHDVPIANVVAWAPRTLEVPISVTARRADARPEALNVQVVAPAPDAAPASSRRLEGLQAAVVQPPPALDASVRRMGDLSIGPSQAVAPAPQLPIAAQRAAQSLGDAVPAVVPPSPAVQNAGLANSGERLIALGIHPIAASGPVESPGGNRRGTFAASPSGRADAEGTPGLASGSQSGAGNAAGHGSGNGTGSGEKNGLPSGLHVGAGSDPANSSAAAGNGTAPGAGGDRQGSQNPTASPLMAKLEPPRVSALPHRPSPTDDNVEDPEDRAVFGDRKFYALTLNMPNLNSGGGSWIIHFAELNQNSDKSELTSPSPVQTADPGYPLELMKQNVKGTVTLYAVIRSDGSVADIRVLRSSDDRLEPFARAAFARWRFRPATKSGSAVDLAAVVTIPFRPGKLRSGF